MKEMKVFLSKVLLAKSWSATVFIMAMLGYHSACIHAQCPPNAGVLDVPKTICQGDTLSLSSTEVGGTWSVSDSTKAKIVGENKDKIAGIAAGQVKIFYKIPPSNTCGAISDSVTSTVKNISAGTITNTTYVCLNATTTLTVTGISGGTWESSDNTIISIANPTVGAIKGEAGGTAIIKYKVVSTDGCADSTSRSISVPTSETILINGATEICQGESMSLTVTPSGESGSSSWASSDASKVSINNGFVNGISTGTAQITYTGKYGEDASCTITSQPYLITVKPSPVAGTINFGNTVNVCTGSVKSLSVTGADLGGTWSSDSIKWATVDPQQGNVTLVTIRDTVKSGKVRIRYTVTIGSCSRNASVELNISAKPHTGLLFGPDTMAVDAKSIFSTTGAAGSIGTWSSSNTSVATIDPNNGLVNARAIGTTTIKYTVVTPLCGTDIAELPLVVVAATPDIPKPPIQPPALNVSDISISDVSLFPNPSSGVVSLRYTLLQANRQLHIQLLDLNGKVMENRIVQSSEGENVETFDLVNLASGIYTLTIRTNDSLERIRMIKK